MVPLDLKSDEQELKAFNVRMDDLYAIDLTFLQGFDQPTLAYLAEVRLCTQDINPTEYLRIFMIIFFCREILLYY